MKFKPGDKIKMLGGCSGVESGELCEVYYNSGLGELYAKPSRMKINEGGCHCQYLWILISHGESITKTKGRIEITC